MLLSCSEGTGDGLACVSFSLSEEKALYAQTDTATAYYTYTAQPLFTLEHPAEIVGIRSTEYDFGPDGGAEVGYFTAGRWRFHVYAYNAAGFLIREGETEVYLRKTASGVRNTVPVTLARSTSRTGSIRFTFVTNDVSASGGRIGISWSCDQGAFTAEEYRTPVSQADNVSTYDFTLEGLQSGVYVFRIALYDGAVRIGGSTVSAYILGSDPVAVTTTVTGQVYPAEHLLVGFTMDVPEVITGTVGEYSVTGEVGTPSVFTWTPQTGEAVRYAWYLDGVLQSEGTSASWSWTPSAPGAYTVTCVGLSATGLETGSAVCLLTVPWTTVETFSATWESPSGTKSVPYTGTARASTLVRLAIEDSTTGRTVYRDYLTLARQSEGVYTCSVGVSGRTLSFRLQGGALTMTPSVALTGWTVTVEGLI